METVCVCFVCPCSFVASGSFALADGDEAIADNGCTTCIDIFHLSHSTILKPVRDKGCIIFGSNQA